VEYQLAQGLSETIDQWTDIECYNQSSCPGSVCFTVAGCDPRYDLHSLDVVDLLFDMIHDLYDYSCIADCKPLTRNPDDKL
jgi:hypothetical protein